jgi:hypothetical protein
MTEVLQLTLNVLKSHRQPQCILQLVCEDRVLFVSLDLHVSLCWQLHPKCEPAIRLLYPTFLLQTSLFIQPHKQKCNGFMSAVANGCIPQPSQLDACP